jgi:hypothetical protein
LAIKTQNVRAFRMAVPWRTEGPDYKISIDNWPFEIEDKRPFKPEQGQTLTYFATRDAEGKWSLGVVENPRTHAVKAGGTCIEDAFLSRFVVVLPDKPGRNPQTDAWVQTESQHFIQRWRQLMRGDPMVVKASEIGADKATQENLILWGDDLSNAAIAQRLPELPVKWDGDQLVLGKHKFASATHVPLLIHPEVPYAEGQRYIVLNSGLTFREGHDKTNSLQNPKLPDWAILDITTPPDSTQAGKVVAADFFDAQWRLK